MPVPSIAERVVGVRARIAAAAERSGRDPAGIRLIAVTKTVAPSGIAEAAAAGITDIGENRVQEARLKHSTSPRGLHWHLIGHLQSNKAALASQLFDTIHSIDSVRIGEALSRHRGPDRGPLVGLVEVDLTGGARRTGSSAEAVEEVAASVSRAARLRLAGLMTMAPFGDPEGARECFRRLRELRDRLSAHLALDLPELSMGMSDDFEIAVEEGATMVRVGRAIFGEREPPG